ncbi:hypothetical protein [Gordonia sp. WA4-43]|uniref:hypothetical protein n=1 Tax=Gordonia sp. WA4-43 TaxID=2878678 RepID=UPI001CFBF53C|nr:hypothetical protein [Gordonia sp. WA4-43]UCZ88643.1 hypothetical protein LEL84_16355 [Gordonia sp. WA4-43]
MIRELSAAARSHPTAALAALGVGVFALLSAVLADVDPAIAVVSFVLATVVVLAIAVPAGRRRYRLAQERRNQDLADRADDQNRRWNEHGHLW